MSNILESNFGGKIFIWWQISWWRHRQWMKKNQQFFIRSWQVSTCNSQPQNINNIWLSTENSSRYTLTYTQLRDQFWQLCLQFWNLFFGNIFSNFLSSQKILTENQIRNSGLIKNLIDWRNLKPATNRNVSKTLFKFLLF